VTRNNFFLINPIRQICRIGLMIGSVHNVHTVH